MSLLPKDPHGCPFLLLAPMEGVGDRCFRKAMAAAGGFDEAVTEFLRVPANAHVQSLALRYQHDELAPIPLAAQIMGSDPSLMADMAGEIESRGAPRIDLNCGCPSNTVTGRGAGSSLLKDPDFLFKVAAAMVKAVKTPVTIKMRTGFEDTSLFKENMLAAQESGVRYITLHARTKADGYGPPAKWEYIAEAKSIVKIPVVGNGDILNVQDALNMLKQTGCDGLMIGRGSVINPFVFHQIRSHFSGKPFQATWEDFIRYINAYIAEIPAEMPVRNKISKIKQWMGFLFKGSPALLEQRQKFLTTLSADPDTFIANAIKMLEAGWRQDNKG